MDDASDKSWKAKRDNVTQQFEKIQEDLERMDEFDTHVKSKINRPKTLVKRIETLVPTALGAHREESIQHEGGAKTKTQPKLIMKKGRLIECYLYLQNHFMRNYPLQGKLALLVEEETRPTPTMEES
jgi:hypothetical protein